jgi:hypothetical protein
MQQVVLPHLHPMQHGWGQSNLGVMQQVPSVLVLARSTRGLVLVRTVEGRVLPALEGGLLLLLQCRSAASQRGGQRERHLDLQSSTRTRTRNRNLWM